MPEVCLPQFQVVGFIYSSSRCFLSAGCMPVPVPAAQCGAESIAHPCAPSQGIYAENMQLSLVTPARLLLPVPWEVKSLWEFLPFTNSRKTWQHSRDLPKRVDVETTEFCPQEAHVGATKNPEATRSPAHSGHSLVLGVS